MLSARELDVEQLADQARTWTNERLVYTHGFGITAVPVDGITSQGQPDYLVGGIGTERQLAIGEPRIYFGEATTDTYVVTGTDTAEFDFPLSESSEAGATTTWQGTTGVGVGNFFSRLMFAFRFGDLNLLISNQLTDDSQILFRRAVAGTGPGARPIPDLRPRPVHRQRRPAAALGVGCLHPDQPLSERAAARRRQPLPRRQLRAEQRQGGDGRLRRHGALLHCRAGRADPAGVVEDLPGAVRADVGHARRAAGAPALPGGPVHRPEPVLPPLSPARHRGRRHQLLQPGGPLGDPR